jgi:hypothetical protein
MTCPSRLSLILCSIIVFAGLFLLAVADLPAIRPPDVSPKSGQVIVRSPGVIQGTASSVQPGLVVVQAFIDGEELPGSPDETMDGQHNEYTFQIPPGKVGRRLVIRATDEEGLVTEVIHQIR